MTIEAGVKAGGLVRLKSGGPEMIASTISSCLCGTSKADCYWFDDEGHAHNYVFPVECLEEA